MFLASPSSLVQCVQVRLEPTRVKHLSGATLSNEQRAIYILKLSIMTHCTMTLSIMTLSKMTLRIMTIGTTKIIIMTLSVKTFSIMIHTMMKLYITIISITATI
jgi:hypothetical protein